MKCNKKERISLYVGGLLDELETKEIEKHISTCEECKELYKEELRIEKEFEEAFLNEDLDLEKIKKNIRASIDTNKYSNKKKKGLKIRRTGIAIAICLMCGIIIFSKTSVSNKQDVVGLKNRSVQPARYEMKNSSDKSYLKVIEVKIYDENINWIYNEKKDKQIAKINQGDGNFNLLYKDCKTNAIYKIHLIKRGNNKVAVDIKWYNNEIAMITTGIYEHDKLVGKNLIAFDTVSDSEMILYEENSEFNYIKGIDIKQNTVDVTIQEYEDKKMEKTKERIETIYM
ncbi:MAG: anti-sigma factor family protein [Clostridium sp.]